MSYRDWLVGGMMQRYFERAITEQHIGPAQVTAALDGKSEIQRVVELTHRVADAVMERRY